MPGIEHPGSTGVIYCSDRAMANGFTYAYVMFTLLLPVASRVTVDCLRSDEGRAMNGLILGKVPQRLAISLKLHPAQPVFQFRPM